MNPTYSIIKALPALSFYAALPSAKVSKSESPWSVTVMTLIICETDINDKMCVVDLPDAKQFTGSSAKSDVGASEVVHGCLGQHGVVLNFRLAQGWTVSGDQDKLGYEREHRKMTRKAIVSQRDLLSLTLQSP